MTGEQLLKEKEINNTQKINQEFLDELLAVQEKFNDMFSDLSIYITELQDWEEENLGIKNNSEIGYYNSEVEIENGKIYLNTFGDPRDYEQLGYEMYHQSYPLDKLFDTSWRDEARKKYLKVLEEKQKEKEVKDIQKAKEFEEYERAEYERLKAKFEQHT